MTENDDPAEAMLRLETALERIAARLAAGAPAAGRTGGAAEAAADQPAELLDRVDALIARLRNAIGPQEV